MNRILVTIRINHSENEMTAINADLIEYINPSISDTRIHFIDGTSITVKESPADLRKLIRKKK